MSDPETEFAPPEKEPTGGTRTKTTEKNEPEETAEETTRIEPSPAKEGILSDEPESAKPSNDGDETSIEPSPVKTTMKDEPEPELPEPSTNDTINDVVDKDAEEEGAEEDMNNTISNAVSSKGEDAEEDAINNVVDSPSEEAEEKEQQDVSDSINNVVESPSKEEEEEDVNGGNNVMELPSKEKEDESGIINDNDDNNPPKRKSSLVKPPVTVKDDDEDDDDDAEEKEENDQNNKTDFYDNENPWVTRDSDIRDPKRRICVVTTAALPWRTGTAVNPLLRALYLTRGRAKHAVSLVIPWCPDENDRKLTLGKDHSFANQQEQEAWIRKFCRERAGCPEEEENLKIIFYDSKYNEGFGSIFPTVDICAIIPDKDADVAILEEPEHLNWLRVPKPYEEKSENGGKENVPTVKSHTGKKVATAKEKAELGWRFKFRHVVGIIHTNYKAYAEQYGFGVKLITAPALCALNSLVVRAYCHRVIRLSATLPSLTPYKEVTCNVHGVRGEFLERPDNNQKDDKGNSSTEERKEEKYAPVYFIGKLIWAKGFDKVLDLQNIYHEKHDEYFPIDVYGAGGDEKPIKRAFFGRIPQIQRNDSPKSDDEVSSPTVSETAEVFTWETSLRSHLVDATPFKETEKHEFYDDIDNVVKRRSSLRDLNATGRGLSAEEEKPPAADREAPKKRASVIEDLSEKVVPISVLGDLSKKALDTTKATSGAAVAVAKSVVNAGLNVAFTNDVGSPKQSGKEMSGDNNTDKRRKPKLIFDPPQSVFEFRRNPIPARFLGTVDHVLVRDIAAHKIFLNMSTTEVLCTTSAEALAMGKFVILPKHPSNTFFYQFDNCLEYDTLEDCLEKLEWALANEPKPVDKDSALKLSWEGATERLYESSAITKDEWEEWEETGKIKSDDDAAKFHVETGMKGQLIGKFFTGDKSEDSESKPVDKSDESKT